MSNAYFSVQPHEKDDPTELSICDGATDAYVDPTSDFQPAMTNASKPKFIVYVCSEFLETNRTEQIRTFVHEGSHHLGVGGNTEDVDVPGVCSCRGVEGDLDCLDPTMCYGRKNCQKLAQKCTSAGGCGKTSEQCVTSGDGEGQIVPATPPCYCWNATNNADNVAYFISDVNTGRGHQTSAE